MEQHYDLIIRVPSSKLQTIIGLLVGEATVQGLTPVIPTDGLVLHRSKRRRGSSPVSVVRPGQVKGTMRGVDRVYEIMQREKRVYNYRELANQLPQYNLAANSVGGYLTDLVNQGKVRRVGNGLYVLPGVIAGLPLFQGGNGAA